MFDLEKILFTAFIYLSPILLVLAIISLATGILLKRKNKNYRKVFLAGCTFLTISILIFIVPAIIIGLFGVVPE